MSRDKQIEEMANDYYEAMLKARGTLGSMNQGAPKWYAKELYAKGYRKIHDDHQRQCTCYALGCQMAEQLEKKVAEEFILAVDEMMECVCAMTGCALTYFGKYAELKKKYTEVAERREDIENSPADCSTPSVTDQKGEGE